jgi:UDP-3-O-[3-hydroxymyristoyl] glucosamine N-acyltransferase
MADPRFFHCEGPLSAGEIATLVAGTCTGDGAASYNDIASLEKANQQMIGFFTNPKLSEQLQASRAGAMLVRPDHADLCPAHMNVIACADPYRAMAQVAQALYPLAARARPMPGEGQQGAVHETAHLGDNVQLSHGAIISAGAEIGAGTIIGAGAVIGHGVVIGRDCVIGPNSNIGYCLMGNRVIVHAGAVVGSDGFGFAPGAEFLKIPQLGRVVIQDDVEIGANSTLDRGALNDTVIGEGTKLDNLVHLAHNVEVGRHCAITASVAVAGGARIGDYVQIGGLSGIVGHIEVGAHSVIGAQSLVTKSLAEKSDVSGAPARPRRELYRDQAFLAKLRKASQNPSK